MPTASSLLRTLGRRLVPGANRVSTPRPGAPFAHLRVAAVVDEFTRASLAPEVRLLSLDARAWPIELAWFRPDFLFVESAWRGHRESWKRRIASYPSHPSHHDHALTALLEDCRRRRIRACFWNKEDPVHYARFIDAARRFDVVFTTAVEKLDDYRRDCGLGPAAVAALPFAVQPEIYFPGPGPRDRRVVFAGSYGESHFPERRRQLDLLLDAAAAVADLEIFDRNAERPDQDKLFPPRFSDHVSGSRDYYGLAAEYRRAMIGLNVNSVTDSTTMFSRRVFEMLACGLPVVSGPSTGIEALLPGLVTIAATESDARAAIAALVSDPDRRRDLSTRGADTVLAAHTYADRLATITNVLGIE